MILEDANLYFEDIAPSPYMTFTFDLKSDNLPGITHIDGSARVHTVSMHDNELFYKLLEQLKLISGIPVVLNTSLNIKGQPIVCSPRQALGIYACTGMDILVIGNYVLEK